MIEIAPRTTFDMSFDDAFLYCITLYYNGYSDWRLPTHFEYCATHDLIMSWHEERYEKESRINSDWTWAATPVRDL